MGLIQVSGQWNEGFVIDVYNKSSTYIGDDAFGQPQFNNTYTSVGELLHAMKYNGHFDTSEQLAQICVEQLGGWIKSRKIDVVIPIPPTNKRLIQPVFLIAEKIAHLLNIPYSEEILVKTSGKQSKNQPKESKNLKGTIKQQKSAIRPCNILLVDDFFSTGETANECVTVLKTDPMVKNVFLLAIAKTK